MGTNQLVPSDTGWMDGTAPFPHRHNNTDEKQNEKEEQGIEKQLTKIKEAAKEALEYIIRKAKVLAKGKGILCSPNPKPGKPLLAAVAGKVKEFCCSDEISRMMSVILPVVLYGCETLTLTLREEHRLRVFENKVLRKIFGAKRDEVTGEWRKLHNTELHALYSSPNIIRNLKSKRLRWAGHVECMGESRNAYRVLVGRPEGKRRLGRPRRRWEDNIKMDLREVGYDDRDWINLAQDKDRWRAYVRAAMNLRVP
ncbi:hypothetical protein ANN_17630 [Periplaneta americana]|uniref:Uncharacterized protein n=1 Tax=Periplaneta americana TaxID=6978 RepID=A0ABQ8STG9_PERAM|nr:hypothetical protein ANN_17630 [Periplaneta americana]